MEKSLDPTASKTPPMRALSINEIDSVSGGLSLIGPLVVILTLVGKALSSPGKPMTTK